MEAEILAEVSRFYLFQPGVRGKEHFEDVLTGGFGHLLRF